MERLLTGLVDFSIKKVISLRPARLEVLYKGETSCPECGGPEKRIKSSFWREIKSIPQQGYSVTLLIYCHKYHCKCCGRYFNTRINGVKKWSRSTEPLKSNVFETCRRGYSNKDAAFESGLSVATIERYYHQMVLQKISHQKNRPCPRIIGIDEHRFSRKVGFVTTFCNLEKHSVFDIAPGRSEAELLPFLESLQGRKQVEVVCMDMHAPYRKMVKKWFPNAKIVTDRFHVIKLINHHFAKTCKLIDEETLAWGRGGLIRIMSTKPENLSVLKKQKLEHYFEQQPVIKNLWIFWHELAELCRNKGKNHQACRKLVRELLEKVQLLKTSPFRPMKTLGKSITSWIDAIARMFRYYRSNGIVEGFHRKMKLIQRRAYGFRNFENYRLRVRVLCG
ncbi:ISL3 family transposase [Trichlorobacter lovleyi]|jgi:Transposase and inactivated derivatives|uniref:Transposase IS204/IS1001/IS1096/IS1165 family protein n=1 Tax=Trichlorobacter lovleyi (strain ATCC BAA-1151 / DSM 17278 / SZ) TaxID=398767 RepID=B3E813_TRIL1|nr:ISL3 family transposase [Trichlorobacter lovleyi]ACD96586.1 transposase IS204/IS1001/IS1096/IS1165 family protein [Trichlorobacter lovleyi SZ]